MEHILSQMCIYLLVMLVGFALRHGGILRMEDRRVVANLIFYVTMPAAVISGFEGASADGWYVVALLFGLLVNGALLGAAWAISRRREPQMRAVYVINGSSFNNSNITMPFLMGILPQGIPYLCMFDVGDTLYSLGFTNALAQSMLGQKAERPSIWQMAKLFFTSLPLDVYLVMTLCAGLHITLPSQLYAFTDFLGAGNGALAMVLVGMSLQFDLHRKDWKDVLAILAMRYGIGAISALLVWLLPAPLVMRQTLAVMVFSAVPNIALINSTRLGLPAGVPGMLNPLSTLISIPLMSVLLIAIT